MTEALIRELVRDWASAISTKDIDRVMAVYSPDLVSFDVDPPLRYAGTGSKRRAWQKFFARFSGSLSYEVNELSVTTSEDAGFVHSLNHVKGGLPDGGVSEIWVRWTACLRRANGVWLIVHDHASVPADVAHERAVTNLTP